MAEEQLTEEEQELLKPLLGYGANAANANHNAHTFLYNVAVAKDTTKLGNLTDEEIGKLDNPIRSYKFLALFADKVMNKDGLKDFFDQRSEIGTATSLSRQGFLTKLAVIQRKELADLSPSKEPKKENKGWFKKDNAQPKQEGE